MLKNATTPIGNCEDNWLVKIAIEAPFQTCSSVSPSFGKKQNLYWAIRIRCKSIIVLLRILTVSIG